MVEAVAVVMLVMVVVLGGMASIWFLGALSETGRVCCWWFPWWRGFCGRIFMSSLLSVGRL